MAKKITDDVMKLTVQINNDEAQHELYKLDKRMRELRDRQSELRKEKQRLRRANKQNTKEWKQVNAELKQNSIEINKVRASQKKLENQIGITGLSIDQLSRKAKSLRLQIRHMTPGDPQRRALQKQLDQIHNRMAELNGKTRATSSAFGRMADKFNRFQAIGITVLATLTGIVVSFQKLIDKSGELEDAEADVMKTTGLTREEINLLNHELGMFTSRKARVELLGLAEEAGRLGKKSVEDVAAFTKSANIISTALGDDLGDDVGKTLRTMGKLSEQFNLQGRFNVEFAEGMEMVGSAINEVSASGTAQAQFMIDYLSRVIGISKSFNIPIEAQLGFAAAMDEAGQSAEVSSTVMNKMIPDMFRNTSVYAEIAQMSTQDFGNLLETDLNQALLLLLEGLSKSEGGMRGLVQRMDDMGVEGGRATAVLSAMVQNVDLISQRQKEASKSMLENTSLQEEYNRKMESFGAVLDLLRKKIIGGILRSGLTDWLKQGVTWVAKFVGAVEDKDGSVTTFRERLTKVVKALSALTLGVIAYNASLKLASVSQRSLTALTKGYRATLLMLNGVKAAFTLNTTRAAAAESMFGAAVGRNKIALIAYRSAVQLAAAAKAILSGNIRGAIVALRAFSATFIASPIGLIAGILTAGAAAWYLFTERMTEAEKVQKSINDVNTEAQKNIVKTKMQLESLMEVVEDETQALEAREAAIKDLRKISPKYLGDLNLEKVETGEAARAVKNYTKELLRNAQIKASDAKLEELYKKRIDVLNQSAEEATSWSDKLMNAWASLGGVLSYNNMISIQGAKNRDEEIQKIDAQIEALAKYNAELEMGGESIEGPKVGETTMIDGVLYKWNGSNWIKVNFDKDPQDDGSSTFDPQSNLDSMGQQFADAWQKQFEQAKSIIEESNRLMEQELLERLNNGQLTEQEFNDQMLLQEQMHLQAMIDLKKQFGQDYLEEKRKQTEKEIELNNKVKDNEKTRWEAAVESMEQTAMAAAMQAETVEEGVKNVINAIRREIQAYIAKAVASFVTQQIGATGLIGVITSAASAALVTGALNQVIPNFRSGYYNVDGEDGNRYTVRNGGAPTTQLVSQPTEFIAGEDGSRFPELIVDGPTRNRMELDYPGITNAILASRFPGGNKPAIGGGQSNPVDLAPLESRLARIEEALLKKQNIELGDAAIRELFRHADSIYRVMEKSKVNRKS